MLTNTVNELRPLTGIIEFQFLHQFNFIVVQIQKYLRRLRNNVDLGALPVPLLIDIHSLTPNTLMYRGLDISRKSLSLVVSNRSEQKICFKFYLAMYI